MLCAYVKASITVLNVLLSAFVSFEPSTVITFSAAAVGTGAGVVSGITTCSGVATAVGTGAGVFVGAGVLSGSGVASPSPLGI